MKTTERNGTLPKNRLPPPPSETVSNGSKAEQPPVHENPLRAPSETVSNGKKPEAPPPTDAGRASDGRFAAGNKFAAGNPFARRMAKLRSAMLEAVTEADLQAGARKMAELAKGGDVAAFKLLLEYTVGRPTPSVDPDRLDLDELALYQELPTANQLLTTVSERFSPNEAVAIIHDAASRMDKVLWNQFAAKAEARRQRRAQSS
jgi:hypothetical protein